MSRCKSRSIRPSKKLSEHTDQALSYQARYARQSLANLPNDETFWQAVLRRTFSVVKGTLILASAVKNLDPAKLLDTFEHFHEAFAGASEMIKGGGVIHKCQAGQNHY